MIKKDNVGQLIVDLKNESEHVKLDEHLAFIPHRADDLLTKQVFVYHASDRKPIIFNPAISFCIELNEVKFMSMLARTFKRLQDSDTPVTDLIEYQKIYPFLLFVNGRFIPWESINLIASYGKYYFFIHDLPSMDFTRLVRTVTSMSLIILPSNIVYSIGVHSDEYQELFCFNDNGLLVDTDWAHCIYYPNNEVEIRKFKEVQSYSDMEFELSADYKYFPENFFIWNSDGTFSKDSIAKYVAGLLEVRNSSSELSTLISIAKVDKTKTIDNVTKAKYNAIKQDISYLLNDSPEVPEYIKRATQPFNLSMDRNLSYEENRANAIRTILTYRTDLFYKLYELELSYFCIDVNLEWILNHRDIDGYLNIGRRSSLGRDYFIIVMVNGELYEFYNHHRYKANRFLCPITNITEEDTVELLFFRNVEQYQFETVFTGMDQFLPLSEKYFNENTMFFCKETHNGYFKFPPNGKQHFPVAHQFLKDKLGNVCVSMNNFYYGKPITVVPNSTFRHYGFFVSEENAQYYKLNFGEHFNYCWDYNRYLVFFNGRRLSNDQYRLTVPCRDTTPFNEFEIYLAVPLAYHDRLDVFYLPDVIRDIERGITLNEEGTLRIEKSLMEYVYGSSLYTIWVNGKKIPNKDMMDINSIKTQLLKDPKSLKNVVISKMGTGIEEVESAYQSIERSKYDEMLELYGEERGSYYGLIGAESIKVDDIEPDAYKGAVPIVSIMWELIREHYIANGLVDTTTSFIYDYLDQDKTAFDGKDQAGNDIIDAMNAERRDNLDIDRYYP